MTLSNIVAIVSSVLNVMFLILIYKGIYIPNWKVLLLLIVLFVSVYGLARFVIGEPKDSKVFRVHVFNVTMFVAYMLSVLVYHNWKLERVISPFGMMKITLLILIALIVYLNFVYIRAEISYKRKRGNIRIQQEKPKSIFEKLKEKKSDDEIVVQLGFSTESKDRTPPV